MPFITAPSILSTKNSAGTIIVPVNRALRFVGASVTVDGPAQTLITIAAGTNTFNESGNIFTGGSPATPNEFLGSTNDFDLVIRRNNIEILRVVADGLSLNGNFIHDVADPLLAQDAATKAYVDAFSPTGDPNTLAYFDAFGSLTDNISAKFNDTQNSMAFGREATAGVITSSGFGSIAIGNSEISAAVNSTGIGGIAAGNSNNLSILQAINAAGPVALGFADDNSSISSSGDGSIAHGICANNNSGISASGAGADAAGQAVTGANIVASGFGSMARGDTSGALLGIFATASGSFATGSALGGLISASGLGSIAHGSVAGASTIQALNVGSHAAGISTGTALIQANGDGSFAHGNAADAGTSINASSPGAFVHGFADSGSQITANGQGSSAFGRISGGGVIQASASGSFAFGTGINPVNISASGPGSLAFGVSQSASITASSNGSFAGGFSSGGAITSSQNGAIAFGDNVICDSQNGQAFGLGHSNQTYLAMYIGRFATPSPVNQTIWVSTDPLFVVGNGTGVGTEANAFQVDKDGRVTDTASHVRTAVRIATGAVVTVDARTDYKLLLDTTDAAAGVVNLPPGENGLTFRIAGVSGGAFSYTVTPDGGDVMDSSASILITSSDVAEYTFLSGSWYQS